MKQILNSKLMVTILLIMLVALIAACGAGESAPAEQDSESESSAEEVEEGIETVEVSLAGRRPLGDSYGSENLEKAAEKLNEELEAEGSPYRLEMQEPVINQEDLNQYVVLSSQSGNAPDIIEIGYSNIGWLADGDYVLPLDEMKEEEVFENLIDGYWETVTYNGQIWGVIQDTEARPVFFYKPHLKELGWTDEEIEELPSRVENGEFIMDDMIEVAKQAMDENIVNSGFLHNTGPRDVGAFYVNNGVELYDKENEQYVFDRENIIQTFEEIKYMVDEGVVPSSMMTYSVEDRLRELINGEALFVGGGIWEEERFKSNSFHNELGSVDDEWIKENIGVMLLPPVEEGGEPITMSHPYVYVITKDAEHPDLLKRLLVEVSKPEYQKAHAIPSSHIPFTKEGQEITTESDWLNTVEYMIDYSVFVPNHPDEPKFEKIRNDAVTNVQTGSMTPEEAADWMEQQMKLDLGDIQVK